MMLVLFVGGFSRSLQFTSINAIAYDEVDPARLSQATTFVAVMQQLSGSVGITLAAMVLEGTGALRGVAATDLGNFPAVFAVITTLALASALVFTRLPSAAGAGMVRRGVS
jgi:hypothetical protein